MKLITQINKLLPYYKELEVDRTKHTTISYSQYAMWKNCGKQWQNQYINNLGRSPSNISLFGGTSMHETIQMYLEVMYDKGVSKADEIDLEDYFYTCLFENYLKEKETWGKSICTKAQFEEYYEDGCYMLREFKKHRSEYFPYKKHQLIGCEIPIFQKVVDSTEVSILGYIDIVLYDEENDRIIISDIKTSSKGWNKYKTGSDVTKSQVLFYKHYFAQQFNIPIDKIDVEFFIVKRKIDENSEYPQHRIQLFKPASGKPSVTNAVTNLTEFVDSVYNPNGTFNGIDQKALPGRFTCTFCQFKEICEPYQAQVSN